MSDPILEEVYRWKRESFQEANCKPEELYKQLKVAEQQHPERLVDLSALKSTHKKLPPAANG